MPTNFYLTALFLLLFLAVNISSATPINGDGGGTSFNKWINWHVENHKKKSLDYLSKTPPEKEIKVMSSSLDWNLVLAEKNRMEISVSQDGSANFTTIGEAINAVPLYNTRRVLLRINSGIYREKVNIPRTMRYVSMVGNASDPPTITGNDTASTARGRDGAPLKTFQSATVAVDADYFVAFNVKFENTAPHEVGTVGGQAVALRISGTKAAFYNCSFYGGQDTLYDHKGLHFFSNCFIQGSVDFIFGYATSLYQNCYLNSVAKKVASLTAQKRSNSSDLSSGFSFKNCTVTGSGRTYLGRAWGDYSRVVFSYTFMDKLVLPQGWSDWGKTSCHQNVYYGEYKCSGEGANVTRRVPWARVLTDEEAMPFIGTYYIDGDTWLIDPSSYYT